MTAPSIASLAFAVISLLLGGCAAWQTNPPDSEDSYLAPTAEARRNVGKLRRLAFLSLYQRAPSACSKSRDREVEVSPLLGSTQEMTQFLAAQKGYEIVLLDDARYQQWLSDESHRDFLQEASQWSVTTRGSAEIGPLTKSFIAYVREREKVDGLMLVHTRDLCSRANLLLRALVIIGTVGLAELSPEDGMNGIYQVHNAGLIEAATSSVVWRNSLHMGWNNFRGQFTLAPRQPLFSETLFKSLEPALRP